MTDNPYDVLRLPPSAAEADIVAAAARLAARAPDEATRNRVRQAVSTLTGSNAARLLWSALTPARMDLASPEIDAFVREHRRPPPTTGAAADRTAEVAAFREMLRAALIDAAGRVPSPFETPPGGETPAEIARQDAEAAWLALLFS